MTGNVENANGIIAVDTEVISQFAGHAALDCFGIVGMATLSMRDGLAKLLKGDSVSKGVNVRIDDKNNLTVDFHIIIAYGVNITTVADNLIESVRYKVEEFTGLEIEKINIYVEGVRLID